MLESLITSKTRIKLLLKFFLNPGTRAYLRGLATEFGESTNAIRVELNRLTDAKLLKSINSGRKVEYRANKEHSLFKDIQNVVNKAFSDANPKVVLTASEMLFGKYTSQICTGTLGSPRKYFTAQSD